MSEITDREKQILSVVRSGVNSPTDVAGRLRISQAGASQALQKLAMKGKLVRTRQGRKVRYELLGRSQDTETLYFLFQAYNSLSQVWAYLMAKQLSSADLRKARHARGTLEEMLAKESKSA